MSCTPVILYNSVYCTNIICTPSILISKLNKTLTYMCKCSDKISVQMYSFIHGKQDRFIYSVQSSHGT